MASSFLHQGWTLLTSTMNHWKNGQGKSQKAAVPYRSDYRLGLVVDFERMEPGSSLITEGFEQFSEKVNAVKACYAVVRSVCDACNLLQVPPEYGLKVQAGMVEDTVLGDGLMGVTKEGLHELQGCITVGFKVTFEHDVKCVKLLSGNSAGEETFVGSDFTHYISAMATGNQLVAILKFYTTDPTSGNLEYLSEKLDSVLSLSQGDITDALISRLEVFAAKIDKKLQQKHFQDIRCCVQYHCFADEDITHPNSLIGMVSALKEFKEKCKDLVQLSKKPTVPDQPTFRVDPSKIMHSKGTTLTGEEADMTSLKNRLYYTRVILQPCRLEGVDCERLSYVFSQARSAKARLQALLDSNQFIPDARVEEKDNIANVLRDLNSKASAAIQNLDLISDTNRRVSELMGENPVAMVEDYIQRVTTQLPPGGDLNLLFIGKTGHGKSSTGNSILGQRKFAVSDSMSSTTVVSELGHASVDGRTLKVIDTPGMCDTKVSIKGNIQAISKAISLCGEGFHVLVICLKFGTKMTREERLAIEMLRRIFGEEVFNDYCIFVFTGGDIFEARDCKDTNGNLSFHDWCRQMDNPEMKALLEQCKYRCVLINNKETDARKKKRQIIELIATVDKISPDNRLYTNDLFQFAHEARNKILQQLHLPQLFETAIRDLELILTAFDEFEGGDTKFKDYARLQQVQNQAESLLEKLAEDTDRREIKELELLVKSFLDAISLKSKQQINEKIKEISPKMRESFEKMKKISDELYKEVQEKLEPEVGSSCFPGDSKVVMRDGVVRLLKDVEIGDEVLVRGAMGEMLFDIVYMFGHRNSDCQTDFVVLHTDNIHTEKDTGRVLVSPRHLVFCVRDAVEMCVPAREVRIGDEILSLAPCCPGEDYTRATSCCCANATHLQLVRNRVGRVSMEKKRGVYAPFTRSGTVVVDGSLMSCYVDVLPHHTSHAFLAPLRFLYNLWPAALLVVNGGKYNKDIFPLGRIALKWI